MQGATGLWPWLGNEARNCSPSWIRFLRGSQHLSEATRARNTVSACISLRTSSSMGLPTYNRERPTTKRAVVRRHPWRKSMSSRALATRSHRPSALGEFSMMKTLGIAATTAFLAASAAVSAGISGGGAAVNGISGGGAAVNGISGGGAAVNGISGGGAELLVVGPVEAVGPDSGMALVLGQRVQSEVAGRLSVGDAVAIFGTLRADGVI